MGSIGTLRSAICTALLFVTLAAGAQNVFTINGRTKVDGGTLDGVKVVLLKDGQKDRVLSSNLARFSLDLEIGHAYMLSFEKDGFVTKKLSFDTHAPAEAVANGFTPFEFAVSLFKQYDDVNMVIFNQPVGMIRYDAASDDFDYDTDYTKSIQSQLQAVQEQIAEKQKQEEAANAEAEKAKAEEARLKAKAEEDAKKAAAQKEAEAAKLKKEQDAAAAKAEADRKKQEAANAKAEQERQAAAAKAEQDRAAAEAKKAEEDKRTQAANAKAEQERRAQEARKAEEERKKAELARAEEERKAAQAKKAEEKPPPQPPKAITKEAPPVKAPPPPPPPARNQLRAGSMEGQDARRSINATEGNEESRMQDAPAHSSEEVPVVIDAPQPVISRNEELIVEKNQVITVIQVSTGKESDEYRKVVHKYGAVFFFKNGEAISQDLYEKEALAGTH